MRILSCSPINEPIPEIARRDVLPHISQALHTALPVTELHALIASYDIFMTATEITQLAVALIVHSQSQLPANQQANLQELGSHVRSLDMRALRFYTVDTSVTANGDIGLAITEIGNRFCNMLHAFPRLARLIYSGPAIEIDMPHVGHVISTGWQSLFNESAAQGAAGTAVSLLQVARPAELTSVTLTAQQANFQQRMQALAIAE